MIYRIKQFFKAVTSFSYDNTLVDKYLNSKEKELFAKLPLHEKRHAVDTASTIIKYDVKNDKHLLIKSALLHDIGKVERRVGILKKSILVLMDKLMPELSKTLSFRYSMFNTYYNHPEIGAELLRRLNTEEKVILLVRYHHSVKCVDIENIDLLKKADSLN